MNRLKEFQEIGRIILGTKPHIVEQQPIKLKHHMIIETLQHDIDILEKHIETFDTSKMGPVETKQWKKVHQSKIDVLRYCQRLVKEQYNV